MDREKWGVWWRNSFEIWVSESRYFLANLHKASLIVCYFHSFHYFKRKVKIFLVYRVQWYVWRWHFHLHEHFTDKKCMVVTMLYCHCQPWTEILLYFRFFNLVLLPRIRDDIAEYKRLNFHLYMVSVNPVFCSQWRKPLLTSHPSCTLFVYCIHQYNWHNFSRVFFYSLESSALHVVTKSSPSSCWAQNKRQVCCRKVHAILCPISCHELKKNMYKTCKATYKRVKWSNLFCT